MTLDAVHSLVVLGTEPEATAWVAIGIARAQSRRRRVAVGDLLGDAAPITQLVGTDDPHGLVDSFLYGVSLTRIAIPVPGEGELFVMRTGSEPTAYGEILHHPRWRRLTSGFREAGALLVLAAHADAPGIDALVGSTDGAVLVGDHVPRLLPVSTVLGAVRGPRLGVIPDATKPLFGSTVGAGRQRRMAALRGGLLTCGLIGAAAIWLAARSPIRVDHTIARRPDTITPYAAPAPAPAPVLAPQLFALEAGDSSGPAGAGPRTAATAAVPTPANPGDSASAAAYTIVYRSFNTQEGAIFSLQADGNSLPAATLTPVLLGGGGAQWFELRVGAYPARSEADSLRLFLRTEGLLDDRSGRIIRAPLAFLIDTGVPLDVAAARAARYIAHGQSVYALRQTDGSARLYVGAFETADQSVLLATALRASGLNPLLVYRTGRVF